jgi:predicted RNA-binding protein
MAFKMKGFNAGKGTGMSPNTMKKGSAMKMKKGSSMKKPLVGDQHKLPQELKAQIKQAPMTLGMRGNAMQGRDPNMAMKASNAMMPGSMMAMKKQNSAMTLKKGSDTKAKSRKAQSDSRTPDNQPSPGARSSANMREMSKRSGESTKTKRGTGLKINVAKAAREKAGQRKMKTMPSPMKLKEGAMSGAAISGVAGRKRTGDPERRLSKGGQKAKKGELAMRKGVRSGAGEGAAEAMTKRVASQIPRLAMKSKVRKKAQAFPLREASPMKLKPGRATKKRKNVYTDYSSDATRGTKGGATIVTAGKEKRGGKTKEFKATTSRSGPRFEKQTKYTKTKNGKTKEISKRRFKQKDYQYGEKLGVEIGGGGKSKKGDLSKYMKRGA